MIALNELRKVHLKNLIVVFIDSFSQKSFGGREIPSKGLGSEKLSIKTCSESLVGMVEILVRQSRTRQVFDLTEEYHLKNWANTSFTRHDK
jgi:hypothetical protein